MNSISFYGAVGEVTGSKFVISTRTKKILLDCGMFQGHKDDAYLKNKEFTEHAPDVDYCILSHAHIDHSGLLPSLVNSGYKGYIYATPPTRDLCYHMLQDSVVVFTKELSIIRKMLKKRRIHADVQPLYSKDDVIACMNQFKTVPYSKKTYLNDNISFTFHDSCHILGSASIKVDIDESGIKDRVWYTSDIGDNDSLLSNLPKLPQDIDHLIIETTYGNKTRPQKDDISQKILDVILDAHKRGGRIIIPAFSVARMQTLILIVHKLHHMGLIPDMNIYVDSPLGIKATHLYEQYEDQLNQDTLQYFKNSNIEPFTDSNIIYISSMDDSKDLSISDEQCIIISASGMCEGGHIREHIKNSIGDSTSTILFVGYNAVGTLGRRIQESNGQVTIDAEKYRMYCKVETISGLSAHADKSSIISYIENTYYTNDLKNIFLVHGDPDASLNIKNLLQEKGITNVIIPQADIKYKLS